MSLETFIGMCILCFIAHRIRSAVMSGASAVKGNPVASRIAMGAAERLANRLIK